MTLESLWNRTTRDVPTLTELNELQQDTNRVIRDINMKIHGITDTETAVEQATDDLELQLTFLNATKEVFDVAVGNFETMGFVVGQTVFFSGTGALNVTGLTITAIQNKFSINDSMIFSETVQDDALIDGTLVGFTVLTGYSWDEVNQELELKSGVKQLMDVFVNDVALTKKEHDVVYHADNADEAFYTQLGRSTIKLAASYFGAEDGTIKVKILEMLTELTTSTYTTVIDIPLQYETLLEQGVLYYLLSRPKHAGTGTAMQGVTADLKKSASAFYFSAIGDLERVEIERESDTNRYDFDYKYQENPRADY